MTPSATKCWPRRLARATWIGAQLVVAGILMREGLLLLTDWPAASPYALAQWSAANESPAALQGSWLAALPFRLLLSAVCFGVAWLLVGKAVDAPHPKGAA